MQNFYNFTVLQLRRHVIVSWKLTNYCSRLDDVLISGEVALLRNEQILVTMTRDEKNVIIYRKFYR